ncbi:hypothetical protein CGI72_04845 [Vibrio parahaemolyticus]|nr:hypothetical protein CGI73_11475 [Vibrio parahaemolyticus]TOH95544.1 hypothetical protein CGI72_04845 [Vibrio parahaemolyticus]
MPRKEEKREKSHTKSLLIYGFLTGFLSDWKAFKCKRVNMRKLSADKGGARLVGENSGLSLSINWEREANNRDPEISVRNIRNSTKLTC